MLTTPISPGSLQPSVDERLYQLEVAAARNNRKLFGQLKFPPDLESAFNAATSDGKAGRMWRDGLLTIVCWVACLGLDLCFVKASPWRLVLLRISATVPVALLANEIERRKPSTHIREGVVVAAITIISTVVGYSLLALGSVGYAYAQFASVVCASFVVLIKRLRFIYALTTVALSAVQVVYFANRCTSVDTATKLFGLSIAIMAMGTLVAVSFWIESEERLLFLLNTREQCRQEELRRAISDLVRNSETDYLTGLMNRRALMGRMEAAWSEAERRQQTMAVVMVDIDCFKQLNDTYGHAYGDLALVRVSSLLSSSLRKPSDIAARYGGEEFLIFLPNANIRSAEMVAERIRSLVENAGATPPLLDSGGQPKRLRVSCGVSGCSTLEDNSIAEICETADKALYLAKKEGRNRVRCL